MWRVYGGDEESVTPGGVGAGVAALRALGARRGAQAHRHERRVERARLELMQSFDVRDRLGLIDSATLVCVGDLDPITPPSEARVIAEGMPGTRLELLEGAGHFPWKDVPETYWPLLTDFVASARPRMSTAACRPRP